MHLSQAFVAQKLNVSIPTVHHIESMKQDYFRILNKYCELLNLEIILKDKDNENENNSTEKNSTPKLEVAECRCDIKRGTDENQLEEWKGKVKLAISLELVDE